MIGYWTGFAKNLRPGGGTGAWPEFEPDSLNLIFVTPLNAVEAKPDTTADCEFWDDIGYNLKDSFWGLF
jgi:carboxylesterase type B